MRQTLLHDESTFLESYYHLEGDGGVNKLLLRVFELFTHFHLHLG